MARTRCYRGGVLIDESFSLEELDEHLAHENATVWVDLCRPTLEELQTVGDELGLHALAVENAATERQRPKFDRYGTTTISAPTAFVWTQRPASSSPPRSPPSSPIKR